MEHSITFGSVNTLYTYGGHTKEGLFKGANTWDDWHLIPASRPEIVPPEAYTNYVDLPGCHGKLDLSEYLTGGPVYKNRSGSLEFYALREHGFWVERYNQICNFLHNKKLYMVLDDEPEYYYHGRFRVEGWRSDGQTNWSTVTINYELDPFKFKLPEPGDATAQGYWDRFLFEDIHGYRFIEKIQVGTQKIIHVPGYTNGYSVDGFIDNTSTFPCSVNIVANGAANPFTLTKQNATSSTVKSGTVPPALTLSDNTIQITKVSGTPIVNLVLYGGEL